MRRLVRARVVALLLPLVAACELREVTVVEVADVVVAEAYAMVGVPGAVLGLRNRMWVFLSRNAGEGVPREVRGADVEVEREDGKVFRFREADLDVCVALRATGEPGTCYDSGAEASELRPGDGLTLRIALPDGRTLQSETRIPGDFEIEGGMTECRVPSNTPFEVRWSRSEGARTYINETRIDGLDVALEPEEIEAPADLYLLGLSISETDTTIVFPGEFGVFERFELDQALAVRLQRGLPREVSAIVGISAADRNYVNWARGGNFNPSGQVRVPSVHGDGTGVFASIVMRRFAVFVDDELPRACP